MSFKFLAVAAMSAAMYAAPIAIFGTGVGITGPAIDPNWTLVAGPTGAGSLTVIPSLGPIFNHWVNNGPGAQWVTPTGVATDDLPPGNYTFRTTFDLTGLVPSTGNLTGTYYVDNTISDILINGVSLGVSGGDFKNSTNFTLNCGVFCTAGVNTIDFVVTNTTNFASPIGLRVDIAGTADLAGEPQPSTGIPEPSTVAMLTAGCALFAFARVGRGNKA